MSRCGCPSWVYPNPTVAHRRRGPRHRRSPPLPVRDPRASGVSVRGSRWHGKWEVPGMDGGAREKHGDVGRPAVVACGWCGSEVVVAARLWWRRGAGCRAGVGRGVGIGRGSSGGRRDWCRRRLLRYRGDRSGRGCWLSSPGSWTPAASRCATCPRSPPSSRRRRRPSTGTCSSSDGVELGRNRARTVLRLGPGHGAFNRAGLLGMRRSRSRRVDEWRSVCAVGVRHTVISVVVLLRRGY